MQITQPAKFIGKKQYKHEDHHWGEERVCVCVCVCLCVFVCVCVCLCMCLCVCLYFIRDPNHMPIYQILLSFPYLCCNQCSDSNEVDIFKMAKVPKQPADLITELARQVLPAHPASLIFSPNPKATSTSDHPQSGISKRGGKSHTDT